MAYALENYFKQYLTVATTKKKNKDGEYACLSKSTVDHYLDAIRTIDRMLREKKQITDSLYEVTDLKEFERLSFFLFKDPDFSRLDNTGKRMYSNGFKRYSSFVYGLGFETLNNKIEVFDTVRPAFEPKKVTSISYSRSSIVKIQSLQFANYKCELHPEHNTFIAQSSNRPYMEGHHIIPIHYQKDFKDSLDVYSNIICLCPICHRFLHFGLIKEKKEILGEIYEKRINRFINSGIDIKKNDLFDLALGS